MMFAALIQSASSLPADASTLENSISALERCITDFRKFVNILGTIIALVYRRSRDWRRNGIVGDLA